MNNKKRYLIIGGGGHAKVCYEICKKKKIKIYGVLVKDKDESLDVFFKKENVKKIHDINFVLKDKKNFKFINGVGHLIHSNHRNNINDFFKKNKIKFENLIHPSAIISKYSTIRQGVQIMAGSVIQTNSIINENTIINTNTSIDHDCIIGKNCHIAPGVTICGGVKIGDNVFIGAGSVVVNNLIIKSNSIFKANTLIK